MDRHHADDSCRFRLLNYMTLQEGNKLGDVPATALVVLSSRRKKALITRFQEATQRDALHP